MITVMQRSELLLPGSPTAKFIGAEHGADVSFFWVDTGPGKGPDLHRHPYTETWIVLSGQVRIDADDETVTAEAGAVVTVGAETVHRFRNIGTENLKMVCVHASPEIIQDFVTEG